MIIAFIFAVEISGEIEREAKTIGTLKTLGYKNNEITRHYIKIPIICIFVSGIFGNVLGYTFFKELIKNTYLGSYSLTKTIESFNIHALIITTLVPCLVVFVITFGIIRRKLSADPLDFINENLTKHRHTGAMKLTGSFPSRFRKRVILGNLPIYIMLFIGVFFSNWMFIYGTMMEPMLNYHEKEINEKLISRYRYTVKPGTDVLDGEKFTVYRMKTCSDKVSKENITLYGISDKSNFFDKEIREQLKDNGVLANRGLSEKYKLKEGKGITLKELYNKKKYRFKITGTFDQPEGLSLYMSRKKLNKIMNESSGYYNGCYSNKKLGIPEKQVISIITEDDLQKATRQLTRSMEGFFIIMKVVAIALYMIIIYMLSKEVIEKNRKEISMVRILGYKDREIRKLYLLPTAIIFMISLIANIPIGIKLSFFSIHFAMKKMTGWISFHLSPYIYIELFIAGVLTYYLVEQVVYRKIKRISMTEILSDD